MKRREFITLLGGAAISWPTEARTQSGEQAKLIGVLSPLANDASGRIGVDAFRKQLQALGWSGGTSLSFEERWAAADATLLRIYASELVRLKPDVILVNGARATTTVQQATKDIPIVFVGLPDPVGLGVIDSLARPAGNITGFTQVELSVVGKLLEILKEIVPTLKSIALIHHSESANAAGFGPSLDHVASALGVTTLLHPVRDTAAIERAIGALASRPNNGLVVPVDSYTTINSGLIISMAARYRVPAIYGLSAFVTAGGLISYGLDPIDRWLRAAGYVNRILRGEKPADLPVQAPTKFELAINLTTAKTLGLAVPPTLLVRADEVIE